MKIADSPKKTRFPSIPSPTHKLKRSVQFLPSKKTTYGYFPLSHRSMYHEGLKNDEKIISHFIFRYLERK